MSCDGRILFDPNSYGLITTKEIIVFQDFSNVCDQINNKDQSLS